MTILLSLSSLDGPKLMILQLNYCDKRLLKNLTKCEEFQNIV